MKKFLFLTICLFTFILTALSLELSLDSQNVILYNMDENKVLYEKNSEEKVPIASMTKIMTAIVALENIDDVNKVVVLTKNDFLGLVEANASVAGFKVGQRVSYLDLLYGLLLPSGADAAQALVNNSAGSRAKFVLLMNEKAQDLGLKNTHFENETGLDSPGAYSTVKDVLTMLLYAYQNPYFQTIISSDKYMLSDHSMQVSSTISNLVKKEKIEMPYLIGGKTGTTKKAGKCLASLAIFDDVHYALVSSASFGDGYQNIRDAKTIYDYFMHNYKVQNIITKNDLILTLKTNNLSKEEINFYAPFTLNKYLPNDFQKDNIVYDYEGIDIIDKKTKGKIGTLKLKYNNEKLNYKYEEFFLKYKYYFLSLIIILGLFVFKKTIK